MSDHADTQLFIVNPRARNGRSLDAWKRICPDQAQTLESSSIEELHAKLAQAKSERLISVGGDGSVHQLVNACIKHRHFGVIPIGTGSDVSRSFKLPLKPAQALARIRTGASLTIDKMHCLLNDTPRIGVNVLSMGFSGLVAKKVNTSSIKGQLSYLWHGIAALWQRKHWQVDVTLDGAESAFSGEILLLAVGNGSIFGGGMKIAPDADPQDGLLDVIIVKNAWLPVLLVHIPLLYVGLHKYSPLVNMFTCKAVRIQVNETVPIEIDGEDYSASHIMVEVEAAAFDF